MSSGSQSAICSRPISLPLPLDDGPKPAWPHALVVVRAALAEEVAARLRPAWGPAKLIRPSDADASRLLEVLGARL